MGFFVALLKIVIRVLLLLSPLILVRLLLPLPDYLAGMIDTVLVGAPSIAVLASLAFTFQSIFGRQK